MLFRIDASSSMSIAHQIASQVRMGLSEGTLLPGERLPPARDLAQALHINMHTVLRAYSELRNEGVIEMRQGRGAFMRLDASPGLIRVTEMAAQLVKEANKLGLSQPEVVQLINRAGLTS